MENRCPCASCATPACCPHQPPVVGMAYVPWQTLTTVYSAEKAYRCGTLFPELDKPWLVGGKCRG